MEWKRFAKKSLIPGYFWKDLVTKIQDDGFKDGIIEKLREDLMEDNPLIGPFYDIGKADGRFEGKKEGYTQASGVYEDKIVNQAKKFEHQKHDLEQNIENKDLLLDRYENYIQHLEGQQGAKETSAGDK